MKYNGCTCKLVPVADTGMYIWEITFPDGKKDYAYSQLFAAWLCDGRVKRA